MTKLALFGAIHADRRGKVVAELGRFAEGTDAFFVEYPVDGLDLADVGRALVRAPTAALGMLFVTLVHLPFYALLNRDVLPAEVLAARQLSEEWDVPVHAVDDHPMVTLGSVGRLRTAAEWLLLAGAVAVDPRAGAATVGGALLTYLALMLSYRLHRLALVAATLPLEATLLWVFLGRGLASWTVFVACVFAIGYAVYRMHGHRNDVMVERIRDRSASEGYDRVCLTTGRAHLSGLAAAADERGVTVAASYVPKWLREGRIVDGDAPARLGTRTVRPDLDSAGRVFGKRVGALLVDWFVLALVLPVSASVGGVATRVLTESETAFALGLTAGVVVGWLLYRIGLEARSGQTVGKRLVGLVVVDEAGRDVSRRAVLVRNLLRPLDFVVCYALGGIVALATDRGQRLGDLVADTVVVRVEGTEQN